MSDAIPRSISVTDDCSVESEISRRTEMRIARARRSSRAKAHNSKNGSNNGVPRAIGGDHAEAGVAGADAADEAYVQYRREKERRDEMNDRKTREKRKSRIKKESSASKLQQSADKSNTSKIEGRNTLHGETLSRSKPFDAKKKRPAKNKEESTRTTQLQPEPSTGKAKNRSGQSDGDDDEPSKGSKGRTKHRSKEEYDALSDSLDDLVAELEASTNDHKGKTKPRSKRVASSREHTDNVTAQSDEPSKGSKGSKVKGGRRPKRVGHSSEVGDNDFASNADGSKGSKSLKGKKKSRPKRTGNTTKVADAPAHSHDDHVVDKIVEVRIQTEHTIETFSVLKSLFTKREKEMKAIAKANKIPESRWDGSLLFCRLNEEIWSKKAHKSSGSTSSMSDNVEVVDLDPPDEIQKMWSSSVYSLLVEFYESGNVKIADDMSGKEALMVLEYFGIIYAPDKVVFSTFASYMRLKMWSDYFSYREDMANYIIQKCVTKSKLSHSFFTSVEPIDSTSGQYFYVRGKKSEIFDGGLKLGDPSELSCSVVHDLFNDDEGDDNERDTTFAALVQEDFCTYLKKSLPGTSIYFQTCDVTTNSLGAQSRSSVGSRVVLFIKCCSEKKPKTSAKSLPISLPDSSTTTSAPEEPSRIGNVDEAVHKSANNSIESSPENHSASPSDVIDGTETSDNSPEITPKDKSRAVTSWMVDENADNPLGALAGLLSHFDGFNYENPTSGERGAERIPESGETQSDSGSNGSGTKAPESSQNQNQVVTPERLEESSPNADDSPDKLFQINEGSGDVTPRVNRLSVKPFTESSQLVPSSPTPSTPKDPITVLDSMSPQTRSVVQSQIPERENIEDFNSVWLRDVFSLGFLSKGKNTHEPNLANENVHPPVSEGNLPSSLSPPPKVKRASSPPRNHPYRLVSPSTYGSSTSDASDIGAECGIEVRPRNFPKPRPPLHKRAASSS